jgi:hypothetical protein
MPSSGSRASINCQSWGREQPTNSRSSCSTRKWQQQQQAGVRPVSHLGMHMAQQQCSSAAAESHAGPGCCMCCMQLFTHPSCPPRRSLPVPLP